MLFSEKAQNEFIKYIENIVLDGESGYIAAVIMACEEYEVEPKAAAKFLTKPIIEKIEKEGREYNMFSKNTSKLPV